MKVATPSRSFREPDMVVDLLDAVGEWERALPEHQRYGRRGLLALLCLSGGPRISEAMLADRGELDIHAGRWRIPTQRPTPASAMSSGPRSRWTSCAVTWRRGDRRRAARCFRRVPAGG
jgi:integrase